MAKTKIIRIIRTHKVKASLLIFLITILTVAIISVGIYFSPEHNTLCYDKYGSIIIGQTCLVQGNFLIDPIFGFIGFLFFVICGGLFIRWLNDNFETVQYVKETKK